MTDEEAKAIVRAAAGVIVDSILGLLEQDTHQFQNRPCSTCSTITNQLGRPFGCVKVSMQRSMRDRSPTRAMDDR